ncbi:MAG: hypothetical protein AAF533_08750 [Acidobacteriota bacterium]
MAKGKKNGPKTRRRRQRFGWLRRYLSCRDELTPSQRKQAQAALRQALDELRERFQDDTNVLGISLGRKFSERRREYDDGQLSCGRLCVTFHVRKKRRKLRDAERIPSWVLVKVAGRRARLRVPTDVLTVGEPRYSPRRAKLQSGETRPWPISGEMGPGRMFAVATTLPGGDHLPPTVSFGTTGALLRQGNRFIATTAGHVLANPCVGDFSSPSSDRAVGAKGRTWHRHEESLFHPHQVNEAGRIRDVMAFEIVDALVPESFASWPDGFDHGLATDEDIQRAIHADSATGFIWVERADHPRPRMIPVDLHTDYFPMSAPACSDRVLDYVGVWRLRFTSPLTTIPGDSGAPVFLWDEHGTGCRLLGFHFLEWRDKSWAMDAADYFFRREWQLDDNIEFA